MLNRVPGQVPKECLDEYLAPGRANRRSKRPLDVQMGGAYVWKWPLDIQGTCSQNQSQLWLHGSSKSLNSYCKSLLIGWIPGECPSLNSPQNQREALRILDPDNQSVTLSQIPFLSIIIEKVSSGLGFRLILDFMEQYRVILPTVAV